MQLSEREWRRAGASEILAVLTAPAAILVSGHARRGFLLGVLNLSNTAPSVIVPSIALVAFADNAIPSILALMFAGFAFAAFAAGALIMMIRGIR